MSDHRHTILIVDDEPNVRLVFRMALDLLDYRVVEAEDGEAALGWLAGSRADLVVLDLQMPRVGGMEMLRRLRDQGNNAPVVIVMAHGSVPNAVEAMKLGAIDFLTKPLTPRALRDVVAEVLARHDPRTTPIERREDIHEPVTAAAQFAANLVRAKRALNNRWFEEAEVFLKQAIGLVPKSAEAHNLMGVLHELRNEHDQSYRAYRAALRVDRHYELAEHNMVRYYERFTFGRSDVPIDMGEHRSIITSTFVLLSFLIRFPCFERRG
jgi:DNA-binding response OmpR family regulator